MTLEEIWKEYEAFAPNSKKQHEEALKLIPGGVAANIKYFDPFPLHMKGGNGPWLYDVDGHKYVDYLASYGPLILGHGYPEVKAAMMEQIEDGSILYGTPHALEAEMAKKLQEHFPSLEMIRYTNSGTEATLFSLRLAYAFTGKYKIGKFEGHYHGGYNQVLLSVNSAKGDVRRPEPIPESCGLEPFQKENTIILPFNDLEAVTAILEEHKDDMAAVIMEPILTGYCPATQEFMDGLREVTKRLGILLIFDEVKTGFRAGLGGAQGYYHIKPDLTCLGKVIGAGLPMGVVGGRKEILMKAAPLTGSDVFDVSNSHRSSAADVLFHSGTYNGHPLILKAGLATIKVLEEKFDYIEGQTNKLRNGLEAIFKEFGIPMQTVGLGTVFNILLTEHKIEKFRDIQTSDFEMRKKMDYMLLMEGIYNKPTNRYSVSAVHDDSILDFTFEAYRKVLARL
ncbi:MAG TPA: aspartate aminotransferase family protein [Candidatus Scybalocola faecigallinarum]|uniref:Aspartate aminotransferase family protein n=1 Tax=Candidatus Scybalocola faecigallinarum TaxID=2840941 RepID=A0A9D1F6G8_9FIRM|nr:aspartate aminotransferase family protein [Candidatus Scybalocola faecigallinarum]